MRPGALIYIILLTFSAKMVHGQYIPIVEEGKYWIYLNHWDSDHPVAVSGHAITFQGDTLVNSLNYKKVYKYQLKGSHPCQFPPCFEFDIPYQPEGRFLFALIQEDTIQKNIFILPLGSGDIFCEPNEYLLFDFSLGVGDTLNDCVYDFIGANNDNFHSWGIVDSIKVTEKFGKNRTTVFTYGIPLWAYLPVDDKVLLIEGVGLENYGIFHEPLSWLVDFCEGGMESCQLISSTVAFESENEVTIFPNPTKGVSQIAMGSEELKTIRLYSLMGTFKKDFKRTNTIDLSDLNGGIYFIEIISEKGSRVVKKVIKEN